MSPDILAHLGFDLREHELDVAPPAFSCLDCSCGKTTICQLFAALAGHRFFSVNCHLHMETSDFLGGLRPVRLSHQVAARSSSVLVSQQERAANVIFVIIPSLQAAGEDGRLFQWHDGPLVLAMKEGGVFLMDEISLADDSVLERLNRWSSRAAL